MKKPSFLENSPKPQIVNRLYRGKTIQMWSGKVKINSIEGWAENPRIELFRKRHEREEGREPSQDEVYDEMKNAKDIALKDLRDDICKNNLREPLVLTYKGKLLDGNRRFFAIRYALDGLKSDDPRTHNLESVEVFVLTNEALAEDEQRILVEENFAPSLKKEWPDYVKALKIRDAHENGESKEDIVAKFGWNPTKIKDTLNILEIIDEFKAFALDAPDDDDESGGGLGLSESDVEEEVSRNYQYFNEAKKSLQKPLQTDYDFKVAFFRWLHDGKFKSFVQVRAAHKAWENPEARKILETQETDAGKDAKTVVDNAERAENKRLEVYHEVKSFLEFLRNLTVSNVDQLEPETRSELEDIVEEVKRLSTFVAGTSKEDGSK